MTPDVVVIGAGCAGLSTAVRLASEGFGVAVVEASPRLGGRATAFTDRETGERVDNGQHVLFGCYRETYQFLETIGTASLAPLQPRLNVRLASRDGRWFDLTCPPLFPPWHLIAGVLRWRALSIRDRLAAARIGHVLREARRHGAAAAAARVPASRTVAEWLADQRQPAALCEWLWYPLAVAALNQPPHVAAAAPFVRVLAELFGPRREDSSIGLPSVPLDELLAEPARRFVEARGGRLLLKTSGRVVMSEAGEVRGVAAGAEMIETRVVVSAVPWHALGWIWDPAPPTALAGVVAAAEAMSSSPIVTVNLWFDRPVSDAPFVGLVGGTMQWVFDKSAVFGASRASHLSVVASGADAIARLDNAAVTHLALSELAEAIPACRSARLLRSVVVREHRATFSLAPGSPARPRPKTALPGFYLAGDWIDTGLPGTIESAVASGHAAATLAAGDIRRRRSAAGS